MKPLLVAAAQFEIAPLIAALNLGDDPTASYIFGIGALEAARNSVFLHELSKGRDVIFLGTCGIFAGFNPLEIVECRTAHWLPFGLRVGKTYKIAGSMPPINILKGQEKATSARSVDVVCSSTISLDSHLPPDFDPLVTVENIELYSVSEAILRSCQSFRAFLTVTNSVGPEAHVQWRGNYMEAAGESAKFIGKWLAEC
jgi:hypothetical protein